MMDLPERLREHLFRVAGGGPSDSNYDPETAEIEAEAADEIERLQKALAEVWRRMPDLDAEWVSDDVADLADECVRTHSKPRRKKNNDENEAGS